MIDPNPAHPQQFARIAADWDAAQQQGSEAAKDQALTDMLVLWDATTEEAELRASDPSGEPDGCWDLVVQVETWLHDRDAAH